MRTFSFIAAVLLCVAWVLSAYADPPVKTPTGSPLAVTMSGVEKIKPLHKGILTDVWPKASVDTLVRALHTEDSRLRIAALKSGAGIMRKDFKQEVLACLNSNDPAVHKAALETVYPSRVTEGYATLAESLVLQIPHGVRNNQCMELDPENGLHAIEGLLVPVLDELGEAAIPALTKRLESKDAQVSHFTVVLLGRTGSRRAVAPLIPMLRDVKVSEQAIRALGVLGGKEALDALAVLGDSKSETARNRVAVALSSHADERALPIWTQLLRHGVDKHAASWMAYSLKSFPMKKAVPLLLEGLSHERSHVQDDCRASLQYFARKYVGTRGADAKEDVKRWQAWWKKNADKERYEILLDALSQNAELAKPALQGLVLLGDTRAIPGLLKYWDRKIWTDTAIYPGDIPSALRFLAARDFKTGKECATWYQRNKGTLPRISHLVAPFKPAKMVAELRIPPNAEDVTIDGKLLFVATRGAIAIYDITTLTNPEMIGHYRTGGNNVMRIHAQEGLLYIKPSWKKMHVYRYFPQGNLEHVSSHDKSRAKRAFPIFEEHVRAQPTETFAVHGGRFYHIDSGLLVIEDSKTSQILGRAPARSRHEAVLRVRGTRVYAMLDSMGLVVYDTADPAQIKILGHTPAVDAGQAPTGGFRLHGKYLISVQYNSLMRIYKLP